MLSSYKFRQKIPKHVRLDRRGKFTICEGSVSRGPTLAVEESTKDLHAHDYEPLPGILALKDKVVVWKSSSHSTDGGQRCWR